MKTVELNYSAQCFKSCSILSQVIEVGKEKDAAANCLIVLSAFGWNRSDVKTIRLFDGNKEVCRRLVLDFGEMGHSEAFSYLVMVLAEMLTVNSNETFSKGES